MGKKATAPSAAAAEQPDDVGVGVNAAYLSDFSNAVDFVKNHEKFKDIENKEP